MDFVTNHSIQVTRYNIPVCNFMDWSSLATVMVLDGRHVSSKLTLK